MKKLLILFLIITSQNVYAKPITQPEYAGIYSPYKEPMGNINMCFIKNTGEIPIEFMTECMGEGIMPYIVIEGEKAIFDLSYSERLARELGFFDTPAMVELYPLCGDPDFNPSAYRRFYAETKKLYEKYAPKTKLVWALSPELIYDEWEYFPGEAYIDYIGISLIYGANGDFGGLYRQDKTDYISFAYDMPIIITRLASAAYTEKGHRYFRSEKVRCIQTAEEELERNRNITGIIFYETDDYSFDGYRNKLRISDSDDAYEAALRIIEMYGKKQEGRRYEPE